jgi:hypothetical protein
MQMRRGDQVRFSGDFIRNDTDCVKETSLTLAGSMTDPDFLFRFGDVEVMK